MEPLKRIATGCSNGQTPCRLHGGAEVVDISDALRRHQQHVLQLAPYGGTSFTVFSFTCIYVHVEFPPRVRGMSASCTWKVRLMYVESPPRVRGNPASCTWKSRLVLGYSLGMWYFSIKLHSCSMSSVLNADTIMTFAVRKISWHALVGTERFVLVHCLGEATLTIVRWIRRMSVYFWAWLS